MYKHARYAVIAVLVSALVLFSAAPDIATAKDTHKGKAVSFTIVYKLNGGTQAKGQVKRIKKGKTIRTSSLKKPKRKGYAFVGWYTNKALTKKAKSIRGSKKASKRTLYAKWKVKRYSISYMLNSGELEGAFPTSYKYGKGAVLPTPTRNGYTFVGWYKDKQYTKKVTKVSTKATGDKVFYAKWKSNKYSITYHLNGGTFDGAYPETYKTKNGAVLPIPVREGYVFLGWYKNKSLTKLIDSIDAGTTGDKVLYARWVERIIIAHRGYHVELPENSIAAFRAAKDKGFTYFECDVRFTSDNVAVLVHGASPKMHKIGDDGEEVVFKPTIASTPYEELQDALLAKAPLDTEEGNIATFDEMLDVCEELDLWPFIHIKAASLEQIDMLIDAVDARGMLDEVSWCTPNVSWLSHIAERHAKSHLVNTYTTLSRSRVNAAAALAANGADVVMACKYTNLTNDVIDYCKAARLPLAAWTLSDDSQIQELDPYVSMFYLNGLVPEDIPEEPIIDEEDNWVVDATVLDGEDHEGELGIQSIDGEAEDF